MARSPNLLLKVIILINGMLWLPINIMIYKTNNPPIKQNQNLLLFLNFSENLIVYIQSGIPINI